MSLKKLHKGNLDIGLKLLRSGWLNLVNYILKLRKGYLFKLFK